MRNYVLFTILLSMLCVDINAQHYNKNYNTARIVDTHISSRNDTVQKRKISSTARNTIMQGVQSRETWRDLTKLTYEPTMSLAKGMNNNVFECYSNIVKQNGWFRGVDKPISLSSASHSQVYYKFSNMNDVGHWTRMQAFNGYHKLTTNHSIGTYLVNQFDESDHNLDKEWKEKLKTVCQWEFFSDNSGNDVIQEIGLDELGNVVYVYIPVRNGNKIYGGFFDSWGKPISMRLQNDSVKSEANYVSVTLDENGYENILEFTDAGGYRKYNKDGVYATRYIYDKSGHKVKEESLNMLGEPTIDAWGNCGYITKYDSKGNAIESYYIDDKGNPMRMPVLREGSRKIFKTKYEYDKWGRNTSQKFFTMEDVPDIDSLTCIREIFIDSLEEVHIIERGVHEFRSKYNDRGQCVDYSAYDTKGKRVPMDSTGIAQIVRDFDANGKQTLFSLYDAKGNFVNNGQGTCSVKSKYSRKGELQEEKGYTCVGDSVLPDYTYIKNGNIEKTFFYYYGDDEDESYVKIDSVDTNGDLLKRAFYNLKGAAIQRQGYHLYLCEKRLLRPHVLETKKSYFDADGDRKEPNEENWAYCITWDDSLSHTSTIRQFDESGYPIESFQKVYEDKDHTVLLSQKAITPLAGNIGRSAGSTGYYNTKVTRTPYGDISTFMNYNEWGEPAYIETNNRRVFCYRLDDATSMKLFDEDMKEIDAPSTFWKRLPQAYCIELTDTNAYKHMLQLRDGDIIVRYANWFKAKPQSRFNDVDEDNLLGLEMISTANEEKTVWVLRHDIKSKTSKIVETVLPVGSPTELGFDYIPIFYTKTESDRYESTVKDFLSGKNIEVESLGLSSHKGDRTVYLAKPKKVGIRGSSLYRKGFHNPFIITGVAKRTSKEIFGLFGDEGHTDEYWNAFRDDEYKFNDRLYTKEDDAYNKVTIYGTDNLNENRKAKFYFNGSNSLQYYVDIVTVGVDDDTYKTLFNRCNTNLVDTDSLTDAEEPMRTPMELYELFTGLQLAGINTMHIDESLGSDFSQLEESIGAKLTGCDLYLIMTDKDKMSYISKRKYQKCIAALNWNGYERVDDDGKFYKKINKDVGKKKKSNRKDSNDSEKQEYVLLSGDEGMIIISGNINEEDQIF